MSYPSTSQILMYCPITTKVGDTISNTTSETNFSSSFAIPANFLRVGQVITVIGRGRYSAPAITAGTTTAKIKFGSTAHITSPALSNALSASNLPYSFNATFTVLTIGASGTMESQGTISYNTALGTGSVVECGTGAPVTIDTTASQTLQASVTFSVASASLSNTLAQFNIWVSGPVSTST